MAYPDKINALVDVTADQTLAAGGHAARHNDVNEAFDELEAVFTAPATDELALRPDGSTTLARVTTSSLEIRNEGNIFGILTRASDDGSGPGILIRKSRGTLSSPAIVNANDLAGFITFEGHDGTASRAAAQIRATVDTTPGAGDMPGRLQFYTTADGSTTLTERMRINQAGAVLIGATATGSAAQGDLVVNGGVYLGGHFPVAANYLDDYEEGTWTPTYEPESGSFATMVMDTNCRYVKIGNLVTVGGVIRTDNVDATGASGDLQISGLPFTPRVMIGTAKPNCFNWTNAPDAMIVDFPTNVIKMRKRASGTDNHMDLQVSDMTTGALNDRNALTFSLTYAV